MPPTNSTRSKIASDVGVVVVDHGSRLDDANEMLDEVVALYRRLTGVSIVEPAHMELAEPTLIQAIDACVRQGARELVVLPYFLAPGRHSRIDIPRLVHESLTKLGLEMNVRVTRPLGLDLRMAEIMHRRILESLRDGVALEGADLTERL